ncbi:MAG: PLP-dependent aminotransferase family protein [Alphaproteobacteria bacterium]|nr:PLP-dependent aminotransferase family protein [Alphaproteobacteria bacterium]
MAGGRDRRYLAIVERIARDIESGVLAVGARLPTHRAFARELGVSVQTVTRAYAEAQRRGLVAGQVGRGTFVLGHDTPRRAEDVSTVGWTSFGAGAAIDLAFNCPVLDEHHARAVAQRLRKLSDHPKLGEMIAYQPPWLGLERHREAGAAWLRARGLKAKAEDVVVTSGAQHGAATILSAITEPGDTVLTETMTDPGIKFIAASRRLNLKGVAIDDQGLIPDALDEACRKARPSALFCLPTHHIPTTAMMSAARRRAVAAVARKHGLTIIENDVYGPYAVDPPPPLASFAPERSYYVTALSKSVVPALRIGYLATPPGGAARMSAALGASSWMTSPLTAELAAGLIEDGTAEKLVLRQRAAMKRRQALAAKILSSAKIRAQVAGPNLWLLLPEAWTGLQFASYTRAQGALVIPAEAFAAAHDPVPHAVRVSLGGAVRDETELAKGLEVLAIALSARPRPGYVGL